MDYIVKLLLKYALNYVKLVSAFKELAKAYDGKVVIGKCDVEDNEDLASEFGIRNIPTILFFKNGEVVDKVIGAQPKAKIEEKIQALI